MKTAVTMLITCVAGLLATGMVTLYSATMNSDGARYLEMQVIWFGLGLVACVAATVIDYRKLKLGVWPLYIFVALLLTAVLIPDIGLKIKGARRWLPIGPFTFQPSELAKLALILMLAWYADSYSRQMRTWKRGILFPGILIAVYIGLIFPEPDRGTSVLLAGLGGVMLITAGVRITQLVPPVVAAVAALAYSLAHDPVRLRRLVGWWNLEDHKSGGAYQTYQGILAFGAGGWTGLGLGNSRQKLGFLPEHHTDFILPVIGEELGLVATLLVVLAFIAIVCCGVLISSRASDTFGFMLGSGITFLIGFQAFINIAVVTGTVPNKGLSLPFISYGGSGLVIMMTCVGLLLNVARNARPPDELAAEDVEDDHPSQNPFKIKSCPANA
jgi:cell division protein FtsW